MALRGGTPDETLHAAEPPLVFCPLGFERRAFRRFGKLPMVTTGPGPDAIRRAFATRDAWPVREPRLVILLGLAGALDPSLESGRAVAIGRVVAAEARSAAPLASALAHRGRGLELVDAHAAGTSPLEISIVESEALVASIAGKATLRAQSGADLVDLESRAFASCAEAAGLPWAIVRGVSDAAHESLPPEIAGFVDERGETRVGRVLSALVRRPSLAKDLARLGRASRTAMRNAAFLADAHACVPSIELCAPWRPLLLFGGSFDPPHTRHARILVEAMRTLHAPCAIVMPAAINPLKADHPPAPPEARLALCRAAFRGIDGAATGEILLSRREIDRAGPSYTVETVEEILALHPHLARAPGSVRFLVGSDAIRGIERWHRWRDLLALARPAVVVRPPDTRELASRFLAEFAASSGFADAPSWLLDLPPVDLASTGIRAAIARGERPDGLSDEVWREIVARGLYGFGAVGGSI